MATGPVVPTQRSLFKKPKWASATASASPAAVPDSSTTSTEELFARKTPALSSLLKEKEDRRRRKVEQATERARKAKDRTRRESAESNKDGGGSAKKRRISEEDYENFGLKTPVKTSQGRPKEHQHNAGESVGEAESDKVRMRAGESGGEEGARPLRSSPRPKKLNVVISLSDEDEELYTVSPRRSSAKKDPPAPDSDDEFAELAALARERKKNVGISEGPLTSYPKPDEHDPVVRVLVTSPLLDTKPLLVHRRLTQRFQEIRQVWCQRQGFNEEMASKIFLTYKMRKIYDVTTCKSLGIKVNSQGALLSSDYADDDEEGRIHVLAVTDESYRELKQRREEERKPQKTDSFDNQAEEEGAEEEATQEEKQKIKILLKARGFKDYKLIVRPNTTMAKIASAFKREYKLAEETEVTLQHDGERLSMDAEVQNTDIDDMDCVEVHIKD